MHLFMLCSEENIMLTERTLCPDLDTEHSILVPGGPLSQKKIWLRGPYSRYVRGFLYIERNRDV